MTRLAESRLVSAYRTIAAELHDGDYANAVVDVIAKQVMREGLTDEQAHVAASAAIFALFAVKVQP